MSRGEGSILGKFGGILRGFNIRWATRLLRETPRADLFSVRAQRSSVGLLGQRQFFSPRKRRWAGARGRKTAAGRTAVRPYTPRPQRGRGAGGEGEKVCPLPPVRMRNLTDARLGSPREAGVEPNGRAAWFPSRSGGNLKAGGTVGSNTPPPVMNAPL